MILRPHQVNSFAALVGVAPELVADELRWRGHTVAEAEDKALSTDWIGQVFSKPPTGEKTAPTDHAGKTSGLSTGAKVALIAAPVLLGGGLGALVGGAAHRVLGLAIGAIVGACAGGSFIALAGSHKA